MNTEAPAPEVPQTPMDALQADLANREGAIAQNVLGENAGREQVAKLQGALGKNEADLYGNAVKDMQQSMDNYQHAYDQTIVQAHHQMSAYENAYNRLAQTRIDPSHWWSSLSAGQKFLGLLSVIVSGFSGSKDNMAMGILQKDIDQDIDAQKANYGIQKNVAESNRSLFDMNMSTFRDATAATQATQAMLWKRTAAQFDAMGALATGPIERAKAQMASFQAAGQAQQTMANLTGTVLKNAGETQGMQQRSAEAALAHQMFTGGGSGATPENFNNWAELKNYPMRQVTRTPSWAPPLRGQILPKETAAMLDKAAPEFEKIDRIIEKIQSVRGLNRFGSTILPSPEAEQLKGYGAELAAALAKLNGAGISTRNDENFKKMSGEVANNSYTHGTEKTLANLRAETRQDYLDLFSNNQRPGLR